MNRRTKVLVSTVGALVLGLGGAASAYAVQHQDRALPRTSIAGMAVGGQTQSEIATALSSRAEQVRITLVTPAGTRTASLVHGAPPPGCTPARCWCWRRWWRRCIGASRFPRH